MATKSSTTSRKPRKPKVTIQLRDLALLSFTQVEFSDDGVASLNLWSPKVTGNYREDNDIGRQCAVELIEHMLAYNLPPLLGYVVKAIGAQSNGVTVGFFHTVAGVAMQQAADAARYRRKTELRLVA